MKKKIIGSIIIIVGLSIAVAGMYIPPFFHTGLPLLMVGAISFSYGSLEVWP